MAGPAFVRGRQMNETEFLVLDDILQIHDVQLQLYSGAEGVIDLGTVESVGVAPRWLERYEAGDIADLAASYLHGFATTQAFRDAPAQCAPTCSC